mmetsp:Transcript_9318/g.30291  ORF Transcript_9318/g.30291 Transcript_9318/m.30291 type:complete len:205 (-) Transcript_9318:43-657(-)
MVSASTSMTPEVEGPLPPESSLRTSTSSYGFFNRHAVWSVLAMRFAPQLKQVAAMLDLRPRTSASQTGQGDVRTLNLAQVWTAKPTIGGKMKNSAKNALKRPRKNDGNTKRTAANARAPTGTWSQNSTRGLLPSGRNFGGPRANSAVLGDRCFCVWGCLVTTGRTSPTQRPCRSAAGEAGWTPTKKASTATQLIKEKTNTRSII